MPDSVVHFETTDETHKQNSEKQANNENGGGKRLVAKRACLACREKKIKCDGEAVKEIVTKSTTDTEEANSNSKSENGDKEEQKFTFSCTNCKMGGLKCVFVPSKRGGRRRKYPSDSNDGRSMPSGLSTTSSTISSGIPGKGQQPYNYYDYYSGSSNDFHHGSDFRHGPPPPPPPPPPHQPHPHSHPHPPTNSRSHMPSSREYSGFSTKPLPPGLRPIHPLTYSLPNNASAGSKTDQHSIPPISDPKSQSGKARGSKYKSGSTDQEKITLPPIELGGRNNDKEDRMSVDSSSPLEDPTGLSNGQQAQGTEASSRPRDRSGSFYSNPSDDSCYSSCSSNSSSENDSKRLNSPAYKKKHYDFKDQSHSSPRSQSQSQDSSSITTGSRSNMPDSTSGYYNHHDHRSMRDSRSRSRHRHHHRHHRGRHHDDHDPRHKYLPPHLHHRFGPGGGMDMEGPPFPGGPHGIHLPPPFFRGMPGRLPGGPPFGPPPPPHPHHHHHHHPPPPPPPPPYHHHPFGMGGMPPFGGPPPMFPPPPPFYPPGVGGSGRDGSRDSETDSYATSSISNIPSFHSNAPSYLAQRSSNRSRSDFSYNLPPPLTTGSLNRQLQNDDMNSRKLPLPASLAADSSISTPSPPKNSIGGSTFDNPNPSAVSSSLKDNDVAQSIAPSDSVSETNGKNSQGMKNAGLSSLSSNNPNGYYNGFHDHRRHDRGDGGGPGGHYPPPGFAHSPYYDYYGHSNPYNGYYNGQPYMPYPNIPSTIGSSTSTILKSVPKSDITGGDVIDIHDNSIVGSGSNRMEVDNSAMGNNNVSMSPMDTVRSKSNIGSRQLTGSAHDSNDDRRSNISNSTVDWVKKQSELQKDQSSAIPLPSLSVDQKIRDRILTDRTPIPANVTEEELRKNGFPDWQTTNFLISVFFEYIHLSHLVLPNRELFISDLSIGDNACLLSCMFSVCTKYLSLEKVYKQFNIDPKLPYLSTEYWLEMTDKLLEKADIMVALVVYTVSCYYGNDDKLFKASSLIKAANLVEISRFKKPEELNELLDAYSSVQLVRREIIIRSIWNVWKFQIFRRINFGYPYINFFNNDTSEKFRNQTLSFPGDMTLPTDDHDFYVNTHPDKLKSHKAITYKQGLHMNEVKNDFLEHKDQINDSVFSILIMKLLDDICESISVNNLDENFDGFLRKVGQLKELKIPIYQKKEIGDLKLKVANSNNVLSYFNLNLCEIILNFPRVEPILVFLIKSNQVSQMMLVEDFFDEKKTRERHQNIKKSFGEPGNPQLFDSNLWYSLIAALRSSLEIVNILNISKDSNYMCAVGPSSISSEYSLDLQAAKENDAYLDGFFSYPNSEFNKLSAIKSKHPNSWPQLPLFCVVCTAQALPILISTVVLSKLIKFTNGEDNQLTILNLKTGETLFRFDDDVLKDVYQIDKNSFIDYFSNESNLINDIKLGNSYLDSMSDFYGGVKMAHFQIDKIINYVTNL